MRYIPIIVLTGLATAAFGQRLPLCADNGESSSKRNITPSYGTTLKPADLPAHWRDLALSAWQHDNNSFTPAPQGVHVTAARAFTRADATFYLVRVNNDQALFSTKCAHERCGEAYWWPAMAMFVVNRDRPPTGVPGDEFYIINKDKYPPGMAALFTSDAFTDGYDLQEECIFTLKLQEKKR
jgi:hypothetical protein